MLDESILLDNSIPIAKWKYRSRRGLIFHILIFHILIKVEILNQEVKSPWSSINNRFNL